MNKHSVLVVAAHPDDELLGVGGTIKKHTSIGDTVHALILGEGETSRWMNRDLAEKNTVQSLHRHTVEAATILGIKNVDFADFPDNRFDHVDFLDIVKKVEGSIEETEPKTIYTHFRNDLNIDHRLTYQAVVTATRPMPGEKVHEIYAFETLSASEWNFGADAFSPNKFVDITETLEVKVAAMECYRGELREFPHPRSLDGIRTLAAYRGMQSGFIAAEGFEVIRIGDCI